MYTTFSHRNGLQSNLIVHCACHGNYCVSFWVICIHFCTTFVRARFAHFFVVFLIYLSGKINIGQPMTMNTFQSRSASIDLRVSFMKSWVGHFGRYLFSSIQIQPQQIVVGVRPKIIVQLIIFVPKIMIKKRIKPLPLHSN